jgi:hypothetical protein
VFIFVTTHSDEDSGELFWEVEGRCSMDDVSVDPALISNGQ